mmetsp:Transcript_6371/g.17350  ORF Transcript_6371/g.17350 Transcript_6371/m.17350 type:complete len:231 (-) Transcript_6371:2348-3040(-)
MHRPLLAAAIDFVQQQRIPDSIVRSDDNKEGGVPIVTGLDKVVFGTQPACEVVSICGLHPPRYLCYMLSGAICDIIQFGLDLLLHFFFEIEDASLCWAMGFGLSIIFRHTTHRYLVFGDYVGGYRSSLMRMYAGYSVIIVLSTVFNIVMTKYVMVEHYVAWIVTLLWTGIVNYFILKKLWSFGGKSATSGASTTGAMAGATSSSSSSAMQSSISMTKLTGSSDRQMSLPR